MKEPNLQLWNEIKKRIKDHEIIKEYIFRDAGIPEAWFGAPLTNEEIDVIHRDFLIKYGLL